MIYNEDWEKENDFQDSKQKSPSCCGAFCQNCDFCSTCQNKPEGWWE